MVDAWAPEAQEHGFGSRCLDVILAKKDWTVGIITTNIAGARDVDLIEKHRGRVIVGLSTTAADANRVIHAFGIGFRNLAYRCRVLA